MPVIKIHLEHEELSAIRRRRRNWNHGGGLAYGALNCSMSHVAEVILPGAHRPGGRRTAGRDLPLWSDRAQSVSVYESLPDVGQAPGPKGRP